MGAYFQLQQYYPRFDEWDFVRDNHGEIHEFDDESAARQWAECALREGTKYRILKFQLTSEILAEDTTTVY